MNVDTDVAAWVDGAERAALDRPNFADLDLFDDLEPARLFNEVAEELGFTPLPDEPREEPAGSDES